MSRVWVADTCALLEVRRCVIADDGKHIVARKAVFAKLGLLIETQRLIYPKEVWDELKVGNAKLKDPTQDLAFDFAERYKEMAAMSADLTIVHDLMADTLVRRVIDPDSEDDEADIYVLSLAVATKRNGGEVGVLTQERKDLPKKCSVSTACGHLEIVCLPMPAFLHREGIWALYK
jgi:hypothetical protein